MKLFTFPPIVCIFLALNQDLTGAFLNESNNVMSISDRKIPRLQVVLDSSFSSTLVSTIESQSTQLSSILPNIDPFIVAEILSDVAHIALDFTTFLSSATIAIRLFSVLGRLFLIASDYIPDHNIRADEFFFQFIMLGIASTALFQSLTSILNTYTQELTMRDRKCFVSLFYPGGLSWMQYKMLTVSVLEWKELSAGSIIETEELNYADKSNDLYWLYNGEVLVQSQGRTLQKIAPKSRYVFGDLSFAVPTLCKSKKRYTNDKDSTMYQNTTKKAGPNGATVVRIDTLKLKEIMKQDESIDRIIRDTLIESMHERITTLLMGRIQKS
mmetsp:Transcript_10970/g.12270  ORF Transcript_10970/g.12270 Transcript_10970/m.12270 type:complete len:327 (+) Transcript_10970:112-1092(+)